MQIQSGDSESKTKFRISPTGSLHNLKVRRRGLYRRHSAQREPHNADNPPVPAGYALTKRMVSRICR